MALDKLKRIMQELEIIKDKDNCVTHTQVKTMIMKHCGIYRETIKTNINALKALGWLKYVSRCRYKIGDNFKLNESSMF